MYVHIFFVLEYKPLTLIKQDSIKKKNMLYWDLKDPRTDKFSDNLLLMPTKKR